MDEKLYYTIGETAKMLGVNASVLRFWETEFTMLHPVKNKKGDRSYTARDIELLKRIKYLTRDCGYTLEGAKAQLKAKPEGDLREQVADQLGQVREFLVELKNTL